MRLTGTVKWFNDDKGFGFITCKEQDYFVHFRAIKTPGFKSLKEGMRVSFTADKSEKGTAAVDVQVEEADGNAV